MQFRIIGFLVSAVTFPGIVVHEVAHLYFCRWARLEVTSYSLLRFGNPMGYVIHERPTRLRDALLITVAPVLINSAGAFLLAWSFATLALFAAFMVGLVGGGSETSLAAVSWVNYFGTWLAISLGTHAFPSIGDAKSLWQQVREHGHGALGLVVGAPVAGLIFVGSVASFFWVDVIYGYLLALLGEALAASSIDALGGWGFWIVGSIALILTAGYVTWVASVAFRLPRAGRETDDSTLRAAETMYLGSDAADVSGNAGTPQVPSGWYADPHEQGYLRYWNGSEWTDYVSSTLVPEPSAGV